MSSCSTSQVLRTVWRAMSLGIGLIVLPQQAFGEQKLRPVPKASCGPQDRTEPGSVPLIRAMTAIGGRTNEY